MRSLSAPELLRLWERGSAISPAGRALNLLAEAAAVPVEVAARLTIGERDHRLFLLYQDLFGSRIVGLATCPSCHETVETAFDLADVGLPFADAHAHDFQFGDERIQFRIPDSDDLLAVAGAPDEGAARDLLVARCITAEREVPPSPAAVAAVIERMEQMDAQADVRLAVSCPACDHHWRVPFDISVFLWQEVVSRAHRLMREVHTLARAYGWAESDILAMSAARRQAYLVLVAE